ncbi:hypothetical protein ACYOEI_08935 [Singulisphaera rosea]
MITVGRIVGFPLAITLILLPGTCSAEAEPVEIDNGRVKARFITTAGGVRQEFLAKSGEGWLLVASSFLPPPSSSLAGRLYDSSIDPDHRLIVSESLTRISKPVRVGSRSSVHLSGSRHGQDVESTVTLDDGDPYVHIEFAATLKGTPPRLESLVLPIEVQIDGQLDFAHAPSFEPTADSVISDRVFFSPAAIVQKGGVLAAVVPDLDLILREIVYAKEARQQTHPRIFAVPVDPSKITLPHALIVDVKTDAGRPIIGYGAMDSVVNQHVWYRHESRPATMVRELSRPGVRCGFDLFVQAEAPAHRGYATVSRHLWKRYGTRYLQQPRPQAMPFDEYAKVCYSAYEDYQGYDVAGSEGLNHRKLPDRPDLNSWQEWSQDGKPVGGFRLSAPQWYDLISFSAWWNNADDARGMNDWGKRLDDPKLVEKSRRIVNLALSAPQKDGMFPSLYNLKEKRWIGSLWNFPTTGYDPGRASPYWDWSQGAYHTAAASLTAGYLLEYHRKCERDPRILEFAERYAAFLLSHVSESGRIPSWFGPDLKPMPAMTWNAEGGAHAWMLAELYRATKKTPYLVASKKFAGFLTREVMPNQKWADFETFYSCAIKPETFFDARTGQPGRDTMSMLWALQSFTSLYETTGEADWLDHAQAMADYLSLFQAVWAPPYVITAYPFGGISSQLGDAEWLDMRGHRFAGPLARLGRLTGRQDLMERGVAMNRAAFTLVVHPRHSANHIYDYSDFPVGLGPENIDHEGFPQKPLSSGPSWSSVGALTGAAQVSEQLGGLYLDLEHDLAVGADGLAVESFTRKGADLELTLNNPLATLSMPYDAPYALELRVSGTKLEQYRLSINGAPPRAITAKEFPRCSVIVGPGRSFRTVTLPLHE